MRRIAGLPVEARRHGDGDETDCHDGEVNPTMQSRWHLPIQPGRIEVAPEQHDLEEQQRDCPHTGRAAEPGEQHLGRHGLDEKQQEGAECDGGAVQGAHSPVSHRASGQFGVGRYGDESEVPERLSLDGDLDNAAGEARRSAQRSVREPELRSVADHLAGQDARGRRQVGIGNIRRLTNRKTPWRSAPRGLKYAVRQDATYVAVFPVCLPF